MKKLQLIKYPFSFLSLLCTINAFSVTQVSLQDALKIAYEKNGEFLAQKSKLEASKSDINAEQVLADPKIGIMHESVMNEAMQKIMISQEFMMPQKYQTADRLNQIKAEINEQQLTMTQYAIRSKLIMTYINIQLTQEMIRTLQNQKDFLREISRIAEFRYTTNSATQQDQMKVHVEQVQTENEMLTMELNLETLIIQLQNLLRLENKPLLPMWDTAKIPALKIKSHDELLQMIDSSAKMQEQKIMKKEAEQMKSMVEYDYYPDFMISFYKPLQTAQSNDFSIALEMSVPLWFYKKQDRKLHAATHRIAESEYNLIDNKAKLIAESKILFAKIQTKKKQIEYFNSSLLPLVTNALNSSRTSYKLGKGSFMELLDSKRMLFETQINHLQTTMEYSELILELEMLLNQPLSNLPV